MSESLGGGASRSTEPASGSSSGTDVELLYVIEALRSGDSRFHALFKELIDKETAHVKELLQLAISERDKALELQLVEFLRRLDSLNHAHEQAREKERDFISREVFDNHVERVRSDNATQRLDSIQSAKVLAEKVETSAQTLATSFQETQKSTNNRLSALEAFQSKLLGLALAAPFVSALAVYLLTR